MHASPHIEHLYVLGSSKEVHMPVPASKDVVYAIRALCQGTASETQQVLAMEWIVHCGSRYYDLSYRPGDHRPSDFLEGRRFVGAQIVRLLNPSYTPDPEPETEQQRAPDNAAD